MLTVLTYLVRNYNITLHILLYRSHRFIYVLQYKIQNTFKYQVTEVFFKQFYERTDNGLITKKNVVLHI